MIRTLTSVTIIIHFLEKKSQFISGNDTNSVQKTNKATIN